ncbi:hypothetical protein ACN95_14000 [Gordonia sihwensis]|nr:hypothetical protein [Gordonia sihwensis]MBY4571130.1 hypothetical protein [Gordonia sihwensis]
MGDVLPTLQANHLREGLTGYLATTFALTDPDAQGVLSDFVGHPDTGMFKDRYVRLRLPFAPAGGNWRMHLDWWPTGFTPYGHQAAAFERLSSTFHQRPQLELVTAGTGSVNRSGSPRPTCPNREFVVSRPANSPEAPHDTEA